jgi:hypothetical protein
MRSSPAGSTPRRAPPPHDGPALTYTHSDSQTFTAVDLSPVSTDDTAPNRRRERALCRALLVEALRLMDTTEPTTATCGAVRTERQWYETETAARSGSAFDRPCVLNPPPTPETTATRTETRTSDHPTRSNQAQPRGRRERPQRHATGQIKTDVLIAHATKAQALALIAIGEATHPPRGRDAPRARAPPATRTPSRRHHPHRRTVGRHVPRGNSHRRARLPLRPPRRPHRRARRHGRRPLPVTQQRPPATRFHPGFDNADNADEYLAAAETDSTWHSPRHSATRQPPYTPPLPAPAPPSA